jgi:hypothetical protein
MGNKVMERRGFSVTLLSGESVTIPTGWWHAAYNNEVTVSVNNFEVTSWDLPEVLYWGLTFQLDWLNLCRENDEERKRRLAWAKGSFNIGPGLTDLLAYASREVFPGQGFKRGQSCDRWTVQEEDTGTNVLAAPLYEDINLVQRQGAWLAVLVKALSAHSRIGPSTKDYLGEKRHLQGWSKRFVLAVSDWIRKRMKPVHAISGGDTGRSGKRKSGGVEAGKKGKKGRKGK